MKGEWARAVRSLERGHELVLTRDFPAHFVISGSRLGYAYALSGRVSEGLTLLEQSDARAEHLGRRIQQPLTLGWLSEAQLLAGRPEQALEAAHRALQLSDRRKQRGMGARAHWMLGEIAARRDPPDADEAESHYQDALALAEELGMRPLQARCHLGLGKLCRRIDRTDEARAELATAVAMLREMGMAFWLPEAERELGETT